mmetsp:Transcript_27781/g.60882  ORF Transcript_27781/g.60882 Transcript_27781/m.60882 type:complete len:264 (-) Transcript_27781:250-1041(-)
MICFFFYKCLLFGITLFVFNGFACFSGTFMYDDTYMTLYNVVFTAAAPVVIGMFDRDVDKSMSLQYPALYKQGTQNTYFNAWAISGWLFSAVYQSGIVLVMVLVGYPPWLADRAGGQAVTMYQAGVLMFSTILVTVHLQLVSIMEQWTWLHHLAIWGSQAIWWVFLLAFGAFPMSLSQNLYHLFVGVVGASPQYWLFVLLVPVACVMPDFFVRALRRHLAPEPHQLVAERQLLEKRKSQIPRNVVVPLDERQQQEPLQSRMHQ